jgi:lipopolysaccharide/colanic/teichoic acid biosynthesis glycosyltransferase
MRVWPVLFDSAPDYMPGATSLLSAPLGAELLVSRLCRQLRNITSISPTILLSDGCDDTIRTRILAACPRATVVQSTEALAAALAHATFSDVLLFVDPRCLPAHEAALASLASCFSARQVAQHLVAAEPSLGGTREHLNLDARGRVRNVHRYYQTTNWPFIAGVAASVVPVSANVIPLEFIPSSLVELRRQLVSGGMSSRDILIEGGAFDLSVETGLLAAMERSVFEMTASSGGKRSATVLVGDGHAIDPAARLFGPIVVHPNVRIDANATIVGPALIGEGSHVSPGAVVAHALLGAQAHVSEGMVLRDRALFAGTVSEPATESTPARPTSLPSFALSSSRSGPHVEPVGDPGYLAWKRAVDVVVSAVALIVLSPLFAIVSVLIWIESRGPVLFGDEREGVHGRPFRCLKFRTMRNGATNLQHELKTHSLTDGPHFKVTADPRITSVGRLLRATNVDEIPQFINVLRGDMSLVGPRPSPFHENQICVPWRQARLSVQPGITGLWQICRRDRASGDFHQWIEYDLLYVQRMSIWLDLKILAATCFTLGGKIELPIESMLRAMIGPVRPAQPSFAVRRAAALAQPAVRHAPRALRRSLGHS